MKKTPFVGSPPRDMRVAPRQVGPSHINPMQARSTDVRPKIPHLRSPTMPHNPQTISPASLSSHTPQYVTRGRGAGAHPMRVPPSQARSPCGCDDCGDCSNDGRSTAGPTVHRRASLPNGAAGYPGALSHSASRAALAFGGARRFGVIRTISAGDAAPLANIERAYRLRRSDLDVRCIVDTPLTTTMWECLNEAVQDANRGALPLEPSDAGRNPNTGERFGPNRPSCKQIRDAAADYLVNRDDAWYTRIEEAIGRMTCNPSTVATVLGIPDHSLGAWLIELTAYSADYTLPYDRRGGVRGCVDPIYRTPSEDSDTRDSDDDFIWWSLRQHPGLPRVRSNLGYYSVPRTLPLPTGLCFRRIPPAPPQRRSLSSLLPPGYLQLIPPERGIVEGPRSRRDRCVSIGGRWECIPFRIPYQLEPWIDAAIERTNDLFPCERSSGPGASPSRVVDRNAQWVSAIMIDPAIRDIINIWRFQDFDVTEWLSDWRAFFNGLIQSTPDCAGNLGRLPTPFDYGRLEVRDACRCVLTV